MSREREKSSELDGSYRSMQKSKKRDYYSSSTSSSRSRSSSSDRSHARRSRRKHKHHSNRRHRRRHRSRTSSYSRSRSRSTKRRTRYYGSREHPDKSRILGVFGLSSSTNKESLMEVFSRFGIIEKITVVFDINTGLSRGFGFIYFAQMHDAETARKECNGMTLEGKRIRVDYSITKRAHTPTPGVYMGNASGYDSSDSHRSRRRRSRRRCDGHSHSR